MSGQMDECITCWEKLISEYFMKYLYVKCSYGLDIYNFYFTCNEQSHH